MPRAFDKFPTQRGMGGDSLHSPTRGGLPWQNPMDAIAGTAADTVGVIGQFVRDWLALDQLDEAFAEFSDAFADINWADPQAIRDAITAAGRLVWAIGQWIAQVIANFTQLDLTENSQFVRDLLELLAFDVLHEAWTSFSDGWAALNWADPATAIHPAWMLTVDFGWGVAGWLGQLIANVFGINLPGFLALDQLRTTWTTFFNTWAAINWTNPAAGLHAAWKALIDLVWDLGSWLGGVVRNLTGIEVPTFFDTDILREVWHDFEDAWAAINWLSLTALWDALRALGGLLRGLVHWAIGVLKNLTGIDLHGIATSFGITALAAALTAWATTLAGIDWGDPIPALMTAIGAFITLAQGLGNWLLGIINSWLGWNVSVVHSMFSSFDEFVKNAIEYFWGATGVAGWVRTIELIAGQVGAGIADALRKAYEVLEPVISTLSEVIDGAGFTALIVNVLRWFIQLARDVANFNLGDFLSNIPIIGSLVAAVTGAKPGTAPTLSALGEWGRSVEKMAADAKEALDDIGEKLLGGLFPASQIGGSEPNLLAQGDFVASQTVTEADGWSWDGTMTASGTGGCAKHVSTGAASTLYALQSVKVTAGDQLTLSGQVRTASYSSGSMSLILIPWAGTARYSSGSYTVTMATRSGAAASWTSITGNWTVPATVTSVTVALVANVNSGCTARYDDIYLRKTGGVRQGFVADLITAWNELIRGLSNPLGSPTTNKTWADLYTGASGFRSLFNTEESRAQTLRLNMFGSSTTVGTEANLGFIPNIPRTKSPDMQTIINGLWRGLRGESTEDYTAADVYNAAYYTQESVAKAKAAVAELVNKTASGDFSGVAVAVDFSTLAASSSMPSPWVNTLASLGSPTGSGQLGIGAGRAKWVTASADNRQTISIYNSATNTYYQMITAVFASSVGSGGAASRIYGRSNSTGSTAVFAVFYPLKVELWKVSSGSATRIGVNEFNVSGGTFVFFPGTYKLQCGTVGNEDRFKVWQENNVVLDVTDASAPKSNKLTGIAGDARTYTAGGATRQGLPADVAAFTFHDNTPAATLGSGFHIGRAGTTPEAYSTNTGGGVIPASYFGSTPSRKSDDLTWDNATNKITVSVSGWYLVTLSLRRVMTSNTDRNFAAALIVNGTLHAIGQQQWNFTASALATASATGTGSRHTSVVSMPVYLAKNEYVQAGYISNTGGDLAGTEIESYFSMAFLNNVKPVQPAAA